MVFKDNYSSFVCVMPSTAEGARNEVDNCAD